MVDKKKKEDTGFGGGSTAGTGAGADPKVEAPTTMAGSFDPSRKAFVSDTGQIFPTNNPNFAPPLNTEKINFKQDGTVEVTTKAGKTFNLSKEEYNSTLNTVGGKSFTTANTEALAKERAITPEQIIRSAEVANQPTVSQKFQEQKAPLENQADLRKSNPALANRVATVVNDLNSLTGFLPTEFRLGASKSPEIKIAEGIFTDNSASIERNIKDYTAGLPISKAQIQAQIDESISATVELYGKTKGKGQLEPRFWITKGAEIEAQVNRQLKELERQQNLLNALP